MRPCGLPGWRQLPQQEIVERSPSASGALVTRSDEIHDKCYRAAEHKRNAKPHIPIAKRRKTERRKRATKQTRNGERERINGPANQAIGRLRYVWMFCGHIQINDPADDVQSDLLWIVNFASVIPSLQFFIIARLDGLASKSPVLVNRKTDPPYAVTTGSPK